VLQQRDHTRVFVG